MFKHLSYSAQSDVGLARKNNEDAFGAFPEYGVFCVADGMGGGDDGEVASRTVVRFMGNFLRSYPVPRDCAYAMDDLLDGIRAVVNEASDWLFVRSRSLGLRNCGSTVAVLSFNGAFPQTAFALHAGDSRVYRFRKGALEQMTKDHSLAVSMGIDEKRLTAKMRSVVMRAVGIESAVRLDSTVIEIEEGDRLLICSDGLTRMVPDKTISNILKISPTAEVAVPRLVSEANKAGGIDNVTVIAVDVGKLPPQRPQVSMDGDAGSCDTVVMNCANQA